MTRPPTAAVGALWAVAVLNAVVAAFLVVLVGPMAAAGNLIAMVGLFYAGFLTRHIKEP